MDKSKNSSKCPNELCIPSNYSPEELDIDITKGPNFENLSKNEAIDDFVNQRIITPEEAEKLELSNPMKTIISIYRHLTKLYFNIDHLLNYESEKYAKQFGSKLPFLLNSLTFPASIIIRTISSLNIYA